MMVGEAKQGKDQGWASPWMWKSSENMHTKWWILLQIIIVTVRAFLCAAKWRWNLLFYFIIYFTFCSPLSLLPLLFCPILEFSLQITIVFNICILLKLLSFLVCWFHKIAKHHLTDLNGYVKVLVPFLQQCPFSHENISGCWYSLVICGHCCQIVHQQSQRRLRLSLLVKLQEDQANPFEMELFYIFSMN